VKNEEDWTEIKDEMVNIVCLFCSKEYLTFEDVIGHMNTEHKFDLKTTTAYMEFYEKVGSRF